MNIQYNLKTLLIILVCLAAVSLAQGQKLVKSEPASGARNVPTNIGVIRLHFDENMKMNSWTVWLPGAGQFPPPAGDNSAPWKSPRVFELKVKTLEPDTVYALQLNSDKKKGFQTANSSTPLPVTVVTFKTAPRAGTPDQSIGGGSDTPDQSIGGTENDIETCSAEGGKNGQPVVLKLSTHERAPRSGALTMAPGWSFKVSRSTLVDLVALQNGQSYPILALVKVKFFEDVVKVSGGRAVEVDRKMDLAQVRERDPETGKAKETLLCDKGKVYRVQFTQGGGQVREAGTGAAPREELAECIGDPITPDLWPQGTLSQGQAWSYRDEDVTRRLWFVDAQGGRVDLRVTGFTTEKETGIRIAQIRGTMQTKIQMNGIPMDYDAKVEIDLPVVIGVPMMVHFQGKLSGKGSQQDQNGNAAPFTISGEGEFLQLTSPSRKVVELAQGGSSTGSSTGGLVSNDSTWGYEKNNPICVGQGPAAAHAYLKSLRDAQGRSLSYKRAGNVGYGVHGNIIDLYVLTDSSGKKYEIYVDHYHADKGYQNVPAPRGLSK